MHVVLEGFLPYEIGAVLFKYYVKKLLTIYIIELNVRFKWWPFSILDDDKGNTPAELNPFKKHGQGISPIEMAALGLYSSYTKWLCWHRWWTEIES